MGQGRRKKLVELLFCILLQGMSPSVGGGIKLIKGEIIDGGVEEEEGFDIARKKRIVRCKTGVELGILAAKILKKPDLVEEPRIETLAAEAGVKIPQLDCYEGSLWWKARVANEPSRVEHLLARAQLVRFLLYSNLSSSSNLKSSLSSVRFGSGYESEPGSGFQVGTRFWVRVRIQIWIRVEIRIWVPSSNPVLGSGSKPGSGSESELRSGFQVEIRIWVPCSNPDLGSSSEPSSNTDLGSELKPGSGFRARTQKTKFFFVRIRCLRRRKGKKRGEKKEKKI